MRRALASKPNAPVLRAAYGEFNLTARIWLKLRLDLVARLDLSDFVRAWVKFTLPSLPEFD